MLTFDYMRILSLGFGSVSVCLLALLCMRLLAGETARLRSHLMFAIVIAHLGLWLPVQVVDVELPWRGPVHVHVAQYQTESGMRLEVAAEESSWVGTGQHVATLVWASGFVAVLLLMVGKLGRYARPQRVDGESSELLRRTLVSLGEPGVRDLAKRVHVSPDVSTPCVTGVFAGNVYLPPEALQWSADTLRCVVYHEWMHLRRFDLMRSWLACLVVAVYWFNPLVWIIARRLFAEREKACDEGVVRFSGVSPLAYFECLLRACGSGRLAAAVPGAGGCGTLRERIEWLCGGRRASFRKSSLLLAACLFAMAVSIPLLGIHAAGKITHTVSPDDRPSQAMVQVAAGLLS